MMLFSCIIHEMAHLIFCLSTLKNNADVCGNVIIDHLCQERQRFAAANRTFTAPSSASAPGTNASSFSRIEMASMMGLETLAVHRDSLRAGQDTTTRSLEELDALLDDEPAGFVVRFLI